MQIGRYAREKGRRQECRRLYVGKVRRALRESGRAR